MFSSLLIANRGEIACRVMRTARRMGIRTIAVYSDADANAAHVEAADEAICIGASPARESYLRGDAIIAAAQRTGAEAIHPGYGFLSENAAFAEACMRAGRVFIGPPPDAIRAMGLKDRAKALMERSGVAVVPGYQGDDQSTDRLAAEAQKTGFPVLIKAVAGGGGKGMRRVDDAQAFISALESARREARAAFADDRVLIEKFVARPRHVEMQVFADKRGNTVYIFERDCSLQRRHQKVIEEAPAPGMSDLLRRKMGEAAVRAARAVGYVGAGTVEFIADGSDGLQPDRFWFMEMNTRLQVEHPVTEAISGIDLVEWQLLVAAGEALPMSQAELSFRGHAVEARLYAEDPARGFLPSVGKLEYLRLPDTDGGLRVDSGVRQGDDVSVFYDPMIAKIIAHGATREIASARLAEALAHTDVAGVKTNAAFVMRALRHPDFLAGNIDTAFLDRHSHELTAATGVRPEIIARAAQFLLERRRRGLGRDPWDAQDGFRLSGEARETIEFVNGDMRSAVTMIHHRNGVVDYVIGGEIVHPAHAAVMALASGEIAVMHGGETFVIARHDPFAAAEAAGGRTDRITSPMPGKIVQLHVRAGEKVTRGQPLAVLEAMKMEHTLSAPCDAIIESVEAAAGDQVGDGATIIRFEKESIAA